MGASLLAFCVSDNKGKISFIVRGGWDDLQGGYWSWTVGRVGWGEGMAWERHAFFPHNSPIHPFMSTPLIQRTYQGHMASSLSDVAMATVTSVNTKKDGSFT